MINTVIHGDCLERIKELEDNSIDAIVTDPPYGLSFMGKKWDYDVPTVDIWQECLRVLKPGGYLLAFAGTRTQHRMAVRIEDAGFEIRDMIVYCYGSGFPKSLNISKQIDKMFDKVGDYSFEGDIEVRANVSLQMTQANMTLKNRSKPNPMKYNSVVESAKDYEGWGTALKPALEPITVARKPLSEKTVAENCLKWGTGGINIDECRVKTNEKWHRNNENRGKTFHGGEYDARGNTESNTQGRFPANLIHDGSDEVVAMFPNTKPSRPDYRNEPSNTGNGGIYGRGYKRQPSILNDSGSASRFFYCAKASKSERNKGCEELGEKGTNRYGDYNGTAEHAPKKNVQNTNNHPTVKPIALMEYLVKLVTKEGYIVLDPFAGSGTTAIACMNTNRSYILIEKEQEYIDIINARVAGNTDKLAQDLFKKAE